MPYKLRGNCVVKADSGSVVKCHPSKEKALAHLRALMANVPDAHAIQAALASPAQVGIRLYMSEGQQTVDFRMIEVGAVKFDRFPPLPIMLQRQRPESGGHALAELAGVITKIHREGAVVIAEGILDSGSEPGAEAARLISEGILQTWSPDIANASFGEDLGDGIERLSSGTFIGGTLVPLPALDSAVVELFHLATGEVIVPAPETRTDSKPAAEVQAISATDNTQSENSINENFVTTTGTSGGGSWNTTNVTFTTACAAPTAPPAEFFSNPNLPSLQRYVTITEDGRFMTHLAAHGECHIGYGDICVSAPVEADYSHFAVGTVLTSDGVTVPTGVIALKGGHADINLSAASARAHYDDPSTAKVDVAVGTDEFGIWVSGALRPGVTEQDIHDLRASGVSGDWRMIDGELRLVGICSVNVPGFTKVQLAASAADGVTALVAAGGPPVPHPDVDCNCHNDIELIQDQLSHLTHLVAAAGVADKVFEALEARIGDPFEALERRLSL